MQLKNVNEFSSPSVLHSRVVSHHNARSNQNTIKSNFKRALAHSKSLALFTNSYILYQLTCSFSFMLLSKIEVEIRCPQQRCSSQGQNTLHRLELCIRFIILGNGLRLVVRHLSTRLGSTTHMHPWGTQALKPVLPSNLLLSRLCFYFLSFHFFSQAISLPPNRFNTNYSCSFASLRKIPQSDHYLHYKQHLYFQRFPAVLIRMSILC